MFQVSVMTLKWRVHGKGHQFIVNGHGSHMFSLKQIVHILDSFGYFITIEIKDPFKII